MIEANATQRPTEEDAAMRVAANEMIAAYNENRIEGVRDLAGNIWDTYFEGASVYTSDHDVLDILAEFLLSHGHEERGLMAAVELARLRDGPVIEKLERDLLDEESRKLLRHAHNVTSQSGEDGIIEKIFEIIGIQSRWCVEFGAYDGKLHSNTYRLIAQNDWNGVLIEGDSDRFDELDITFSGNERAHMMRAFIGMDPQSNSLDFLLAKTPLPADFDLISIDIDSNDWHVWNSLRNYRPRVVIVEFNPTIANDVIFIQQADSDTFQGNSLRALVTLGKIKGYELVCVTTYNAIFVLAADYSKFGIADNSIDAMYKPLMDGRVFHCYDATIYNVGMPQMNWGSANNPADKRPIGPTELRLMREE